MTDFKPGDVVKQQGRNRHGVVVACPHNEPSRPSLHEVWAYWRNGPSGCWSDRPTWVPYNKVTRITGDEADVIWADYCAALLLDGSN